MRPLLEWTFRLLAWLVGRPLLKVRILEDDSGGAVGGLVFEVENASDTLTSLTPTIKAKFWFPRHGRYREGTATYDVRDLDRQLPPFKARKLTASARSVPSGYGFAWFRVYEFLPQRGPRAKVRLRNAELKPLSRVRFAFELCRFRLTGRVQDAGAITLDEMKAQRRSQGPH